jgi:ABC-type lipoprotein export system ATPase subunit
MSTSSLPGESTDGQVVDDVYFAVMGASGVGKSSFIHLCTGKQDFWANGDQDFCEFPVTFYTILNQQLIKEI